MIVIHKIPAKKDSLIEAILHPSPPIPIPSTTDIYRILFQLDAPKEAGVFKSNNFVDGRASLMRCASNVILNISLKKGEKGREKRNARKRECEMERMESRE